VGLSLLNRLGFWVIPKIHRSKVSSSIKSHCSSYKRNRLLEDTTVIYEATAKSQFTALNSELFIAKEYFPK
jgi:hypothetical protein